MTTKKTAEAQGNECGCGYCGYGANVRRHDADAERPLVLGSTRSHANEDAWRDMDGFDRDEELARARRAVAAVRPLFSAAGHEAAGHKRWQNKPKGDPMVPASISEETLCALVLIAEAFDNLDERLVRGGSAPTSWSAGCARGSCSSPANAEGP